MIMSMWTTGIIHDNFPQYGIFQHIQHLLISIVEKVLILQCNSRHIFRSTITRQE